MDKKSFESLVKYVWNQYQTEHSINLPELDRIEFAPNKGIWARFLTRDLFDKKYILDVNEELCDTNTKFIRQILYHEFTHMADSLQYLNQTYECFKDTMAVYSEFHAAEREMKERLKTAENNITLKSEITHVGILSLDSFMRQTFEFARRDLKKMAENSRAADLFFNTDHITHYFGYIRALKDYGIDYVPSTYAFPSCFLNNIKSLEQEFLADSINVPHLVEVYCTFVDDIKLQYKLNMLLEKNKVMGIKE